MSCPTFKIIYVERVSGTIHAIDFAKRQIQIKTPAGFRLLKSQKPLNLRGIKQGEAATVSILADGTLRGDKQSEGTHLAIWRQ